MPDPLSTVREALAGRYRVDRELARGGMATVYLADDLKHDRKVAVKVLDTELAVAIGAERFLAEIRTTARLQHPHILPLFDSGEADGVLFYVMPFVEGRTLRDRLNQEGQLPVAEALAIAREVADALAHAHAAGIIHRDVKPENILLSGEHATLADFGIARAVEHAGPASLTRTGTTLGTPTYTSPEQASGDPRLDGRTDVYALGCVLYEMLVGEPPFTGDSPAVVLARKVSQTAPAPSAVRDTVPGWLDEALERALARSPADRFSTADAFGSALTGPEAGAPARAPRPRGTGPVAILRRSIPWVLGSGALLVAGLWGLGLGERGRGSVPSGPGPAGDDAVAVLPFEVQGSEELDYLGDGLVDLLSTKLDGVGGLRVTDPQTVFAAIGDDRGGSRSSMEISRILEHVGAGRVLRGIVLHAGDQLHIRASVVDASGSTQLEASVEGSADDLFSLVDRLVSGLVARGITGQAAGVSSLEELTTASNEALRLYLDGIRNFRQGRGTRETTELMRRAVALDSTFALAAYWAGYMAEYIDEPDLDDFRLAMRHRQRLSLRVQMRLEAALAGAERRHADAIGLYRRFVERYPDDVVGWFQLAEQMAHTGQFVGEPASAARPAYERAVGLDPALAPAYFHLAVIGGLEEDTAALGAWAATLDSVGADPIWPAILRIVQGGVGGDRALMARSVDVYVAAETLYPPGTLASSLAELASAVMGSDPSSARRMLELYRRGTVSDTSRAIVMRRQAQLEAGLGRFERAEEVLRAIGPTHHSLLPYDLAWVALHPAAAAEQPAREAEAALRDHTPGEATADAAVRQYLLARLALKRGDPQRFRTELAALRQPMSRSSAVQGLARDLVLELEARDARRRGEPGRGLDSLLAAGTWNQLETWPGPGAETFFEGFLPDRGPAFLRAELLREVGRGRDAELWYRIAADGIWHRVVALQRLAGLAREAADTTQARALSDRAARLWADADGVAASSPPGR